MAKAANAPFPVLEKPRVGLPPWALGAAGLAAGLIAVSLVMTGSSSWMALGAALGFLLLLSAATAALAVLSGLYLLFLGPSWIL